MRTSFAPCAGHGVFVAPGHSRSLQWRRVLSPLLVYAAMTVEFVSSVAAQVPATLNGAPVQVQPFYSEPGIPTVTVPIGTPNPFGAADSTSSADTSTGGTNGTTGTASTTGIDTGTSGGGTLSATSSTDALTTLLGMSDGSTIIANAQALGVNPSAIAATCVLETGCQNSTGGTYTGMFQMGTAAYTDGLATALAQNPALASQVVQGSAGRTDPTTEAIAATGYLIQGVDALEAAGISNPTVLDVRSYYNFTPNIGTQIAKAPDTDLMSDYLPASYLQGNLIPTDETVGQWRASITAKIGNAASQTVLSS